MNLHPSRMLPALALAAGLALPPAAVAQDLSWSGFATLGYAGGVDVPGRYLRWIDADGTFNADSLAALQLEARFDPRWSATLQLKAAPSQKSDSRWDLRPAWAFLAWRPNDEWLLRAGRMRLPLYLHSESLDIGVAHDMARLPLEMYSMVPTNEYNGLSASYSRAGGLLPDDELSVEAYAGRIGATGRFWLRDGAPPQVAPGARYETVEVGTVGLIATLRNPATTLRLGVHDARTARTKGKGTPVDYPYVAIAPGLGYYRVDEALPGPPIETVSRLHNLITTLGVEHRFGDGWRVETELARNQQYRTRLGSSTVGGYVALFKDLGSFTPYLSYGQLSTHKTQMQSYRQLTGTQLPPMLPGAAQINAAQRIAGETVYAADQNTWALGSSWRTPMNGTLKLEYASTHIGEVSRLIDAPPGQPTPQQQRFGVWTLNFSVAY